MLDFHTLHNTSGLIQIQDYTISKNSAHIVTKQVLQSKRSSLFIDIIQSSKTYNEYPIADDVADFVQEQILQ